MVEQNQTHLTTEIFIYDTGINVYEALPSKPRPRRCIEKTDINSCKQQKLLNFKSHFHIQKPNQNFVQIHYQTFDFIKYTKSIMQCNFRQTVT